MSAMSSATQQQQREVLQSSQDDFYVTESSDVGLEYASVVTLVPLRAEFPRSPAAVWTTSEGQPLKEGVKRAGNDGKLGELVR